MSIIQFYTENGFGFRIGKWHFVKQPRNKELFFYFHCNNYYDITFFGFAFTWSKEFEYKDVTKVND